MNLRLTKAPGIASPLHIRFTPASPGWNPRLVRKTFLQTILAVAISVLALIIAHAGSATWDLNPGSGDWNTAANWTPETVPNGPADIATFAVSNRLAISVTDNTEVNEIVFEPGARAFSISSSTNANGVAPQLTISGTGVTNNSGVEQNFVAVGGRSILPVIAFTNSATTGENT